MTSAVIETASFDLLRTAQQIMNLFHTSKKKYL